MASSSQATFVSQAQTVQLLWNELLAWYAKVRNISNLTTKNAAQNAWKAMATAAQNGDGSVGTADGSPNETHVITTSNLNMSADDLINALNDMTMIASVLDGTLAAASYQQVDHRADAQSVTNLTQ